MTTNTGPGGATLSPPQPPGQMLRAAAFTPAVRGYPGGIADMAAGHGGLSTAAPVNGSGSVWQQSLEVWREAGINWLQQEPPEPSADDLAAAESGEHNTEPIPVVPATGPAAGPEVPAGEEVAVPRAAPGRAGKQERAGRSRRVALVASATSIALVAAVIAGVAVARSGGPGSGFGLVTPYPPAALAGREFAARTAGPGSPPALTGIAAAGETVVAVGSRGGPALPLPLFLVSRDGGHTWARAALRAGTAALGPGSVPVLVVRGRGGWLALGQHAAWTSADGTAWQPAPGVPMSAGDNILGLARTRSGFIAVGQNVPGLAGSGVPGPVLWTSADGRAWQRKSGAALTLGTRGGLDAGGGSMVSLRWAAYRAGVVIVGGEISRPVVGNRGKRKVISNVESPGLWRSTDGGATWRSVTVPVSHGAAPGLAGLAASGSAFAAIRPGRTRSGRRDAVAYVSGTGATWRYAGRLTAGPRTPLHVITVAGSEQGFAVSGTTGTSRVAFFSPGGRAWHRTADQGGSARTVVAGVTAAPGSVVVAAGAARTPGPGAGGATPFLLLAGAGRGAAARHSDVGQAVLAAAATTEVTVNSLAAAGSVQVAAGSANGTPALWWAAADGRWVPASAALPSSWSPGSLTTVAHGSAGWLAAGHAGALGSPAAPAATVPVVMTSADGRAWRPATGAQPFMAPGTALTQAAAGSPGYVVVGSTARPDGTPAAAAWRSAGLGTWTRAAVAGATGQAGTGGQMLAVTAGRPGFVAVGAAGGVPVVWTSPAGASWRPTTLPLPAGAASAVLTGVATVGGRVVAVGSAARAAGVGGQGAAPVAFAAVSADDGRTWRETVLHGPAGPATVTALTAAGGGFVAAGVTGPAGNEAAISWWSPDGLRWQRGAPLARGLGGPGVTQITALSARDGVLTGAGYTVTPSGEQPVSWLARYR